MVMFLDIWILNLFRISDLEIRISPASPGDVLAHDYFDINAEQIFKICRRDIPKLLDTIKRMLREI